MEGEQSVVNKAVKKEQRRYEREIAPKQREVLENLHVGKETDIISPQLSEAMQEAYSKDADFSTPAVEALAHKLDHGIAEVRELSFKDADGREKRYLTRSRNPAEGINVTEVMILNSPEYALHSGHIQYEHYLISNTETGATADMLELVAEDTEVYANKTRSAHLTANPFKAGKIGVDVRRGKLTHQDSGFPHEAGHSHQMDTSRDRALAIIDENLFSRFDRLGQKDAALARNIVKERNAWAFALAAARKYREKGIDLTKGVNVEQAERALMTYQTHRARPEKNLNFTKRPRLIEVAQKIREEHLKDSK